MNTITHQQARDFIDRRLDGMLKPIQQTLLDEHLRSCADCRAYAAEMDAVPARLTHEFKTRWDEDFGPSPRLMQQVTLLAKIIPTANRFSSSLAWLSGALALLLLALAVNFVVSKLQSTSAASVNATLTASAPVNLTIDPQNCKPSTDVSAPNELYGYNVIQKTSLIDGDFTFDFWLYCDPSLNVNDQEHFSAVSGLGIYSSWRYNGPQVDGPVEYYYEFQENKAIGKSGSDGPLYKASAKGKFGIYVAEATIRDYIQQGQAVQFRVTVNSSLGQKSAILSFHLQPTQRGLTVVDLQAHGPENLDNGLIAFASTQNGNSDIYSMHADGSSLTDLTNDPANDTNPAWSPDGKHIAFESDRDGFMQIYVMDADGSNAVQLTHDKVHHELNLNRDGKYNPWSPDSSKLLFLQNVAGKETSDLYAIDVNTDNKTFLATGRISLDGASWSPNGNYIAYVLNMSNSRDTLLPAIYVIHANGSNPKELKALIPQNEFLFLPYSWSSDGKWITFVAKTGDGQSEIVYEYNLETDTLFQKDSVKSHLVDWQDDVFVTRDPDFVWHHSDGTTNTLPWDDSSCLVDITRSSHGSFAIGGYCPDSNTFKLFWANPDGSMIKQLLDLPKSPIIGEIGDIVWSRDDQYVAFTVAADKTSLYILNVEAALKNPSLAPEKMVIGSHDLLYTIPSWQPVVPEEVVKEKPTPKPEQTSLTGNLIAFVSEESGNSDIYTMQSDGTHVSNLTNNPAADTNPVWSPDGKRIAFVSDRDGNDNIYVMNADGSEVTRLTDDAAQDTNPVWSPDGTKIAYASGDPSQNNANIFVMDSNGQNQRQLTSYVPNTAVWPQAWSPDSQFILFEVYRQVVQVGINDGIITPITPQTDVDVPENFVLSADGSKLTYLVAQCDREQRGSNEFCNLVKTIDRDGSNEQTTAVLQVPKICGVGANLTWMGSLTRWSPDQTKLLISFTCEDENNGQLYIANADGTDFKRLTNYPVFGNLPEKEVATFVWSPDSQSIIFAFPAENAGHDDLYLLNIHDVLANPDLRPTPLNASATKISAIAWQPKPHEAVTAHPTPAPLANNRLITFTSSPDSNSEIFVMNSDGSDVQNLSNNIATDRNPVWSPDGQKIAFESDRDGKFDVYAMNVDGSDLTRVTSDPAFDALAPAYDSPWSPDGKHLVVQSHRSGKDALYVVSIDGNEEAIQISNTPGTVAWSPSGDQIAYAYVSEKSGLNNTGEHDAIRIVNADGSNPRDIVQTGLIGDIHWSVNGKTIYYRNGAGTWSIERADAQGGKPQTILTVEDTYFTGMAWFSPDSTIVYQSTDSQGQSSLYRWKDGTASPIGELFKPDPSQTCETTPKDGLLIPSVVVSHDTKQAISYMNCDSGQVVFTLHDLTSNTSAILGTLPLVNPGIKVDWSQDDQVITIRIAMSDVLQSSAVQASLYVIHRNQLGQLPLVLTPVLEQTNGLTQTAIQTISQRPITAKNPTAVPTSQEAVTEMETQHFGNWTVYSAPEWKQQKESVTVSAIATAADGSVWFGTMGGVASIGTGAYRFDGSTWTRYTHENGLPADEISSIAATRDGALWFTTLCCGVARFDGRNWNHYTVEDGLVENDVRSSAVAPDGSVWFGTIDKGASHFDGRTWKTYDQNNGLWGYTVPYIGTLPDNSLLFFTTNGSGMGRLTQFDGQAWRTFSVPPDLAEADQYAMGNGALDFSVAANGDVWFATGSNGVYQLSKNNWIHYTVQDGLASNNVYSVAVASDGAIWFGTDAGISHFDGKHWSTFTTRDGLPSNWISRIVADPDGTIWFGSESAIYKYQSSSAMRTEVTPTAIAHSDRLIAFASENNANTPRNMDIFSMQSDGSGLANLTDNPANDYGPLWSPDGKSIAFTSERTGNADIFSMDSNGNSLTQLTDNPGYDGLFTWSPDGQKMVYVSSAGNDVNTDGQLILINSDGSDKTVLTAKGSFSVLGWSPDSQKLVYLQQPVDQITKDTGVHVIDIYSGKQQQWSIDHIEQIHWEDSEHFLGYGWNGNSESPAWALYRFDTNGDRPLQVASHSSPIVAMFDQTYVVEGRLMLAWYAIDGNRVPLKSHDFGEVCGRPGDLFITETGHFVSPNRNLALVSVHCPSGNTSYYLESSDGSLIKQLTNFEISKTSEEIGWAWSPDGKELILTIADSAGGKADLYLLNVEEMLKDPSIEPVRLTSDEALKTGVVWQPVP